MILSLKVIVEFSLYRSRTLEATLNNKKKGRHREDALLEKEFKKSSRSSSCRVSNCSTRSLWRGDFNCLQFASSTLRFLFKEFKQTNDWDSLHLWSQISSSFSSSSSLSRMKQMFSDFSNWFNFLVSRLKLIRLCGKENRICLHCSLSSSSSWWSFYLSLINLTRDNKSEFKVIVLMSELVKSTMEVSGVSRTLRMNFSRIIEWKVSEMKINLKVSSTLFMLTLVISQILDELISLISDTNNNRKVFIKSVVSSQLSLTISWVVSSLNKRDNETIESNCYTKISDRKKFIFSTSSVVRKSIVEL